MYSPKMKNKRLTRVSKWKASSIRTGRTLEISFTVNRIRTQNLWICSKKITQNYEWSFRSMFWISVYLYVGHGLLSSFHQLSRLVQNYGSLLKWGKPKPSRFANINLGVWINGSPIEILLNVLLIHRLPWALYEAFGDALWGGVRWDEMPLMKGLHFSQ